MTTTTRALSLPSTIVDASAARPAAAVIGATLCLLLGGCDPAATADETQLESQEPGAAVALAAPGSPAAVLPSSTPNILFVVADDIGVDNISAYGEHANSASTPSIDALASDGVLFRNTWANPMCSPSRASLLTGRHAFRHGLLHPAGAELDADEETVAEILQGVGYATALFGKWHLGTSTGTTPADQGYDYFSGALSGNIDDYFSWTKTTQEVIDGVTYQDSSTETGYATSINVAEAQSWIAQQSSPWLVTLAFNAGHSPYHVPPSDLHTYALSGSEGDECDDGTGVDPVRRCYRAMVQAMDEEIGNLVAWLDAQGELDDTLIVFIGDNGTSGQVIIDDGVFSPQHGKTTVYEGGVNVPFIAYGPGLGVQQGVEITDLVQGLDVFSTMLDVAGGTSTAAVVDSRSLVDYLEGNTVTDARSYLYTELYNDGLGIDRWALTNGTAKYLYDDGTEECYNLGLDPGEATEKFAGGGPVTSVCNALSEQRPCDGTDDCPAAL